MHSHVVECTDVEVLFGATVALPRTTLHLRAGETLALMGPSGSGKTTLLKVIQGLVKPSSGSVIVLGQDQAVASRKARSTLRLRAMGLINQNPDLLPEFTTAENVALPLLLDGVNRTQALNDAARILESLGLGDRRNADVSTLSGGEAQRVAVARALVRESVKLAIADEPTASLDADNAQKIGRELVAHTRERGATLLLATHDTAVAEHCDRVLHIARDRLTV